MTVGSSVQRPQYHSPRREGKGRSAGYGQPAEPLSKFTVRSSNGQSRSSSESCARVLTLTLFPCESCLVRPPRSSWRRQHMGRSILTVSFMTLKTFHRAAC